MDALIAQIVEKTGISESQAQMAVNLVLEQVKGQLPESMQGMVDSALGGTGATGGLGDAASMLSGLFGKK